jgi:N-acyl-D-aspartate/D-glutamate deacylase
VSDGGAHTRYLTTSTWPVEFLTYWIRDRQIMSLEQGHYKMSALPGWFADFKDRGTLRVGDWADVMVYNLDELGFQHDKMIYAHDFPGGERRIIQKPTGLRYTLVNGAVTFEGNDCTGALPGKLLRSCDMVS